MSEQTVRTPESVQKEIRNRRHKAELPLFVINSIIGPVFLCIAGIVLFGEYGIVDLIKEGLENAEITETSPEFSALTAGIIVISVGITLIGMASNQLIGFEGRKKECAVMLSTAMGKGTLSGILFREKAQPGERSHNTSGYPLRRVRNLWHENCRSRQWQNSRLIRLKFHLLVIR